MHPVSVDDGEQRECRCMFCGQMLTLSSENAAIEHMEICPSLQEQLNDNKQFTIPKECKIKHEK